ncbi:sugar-binding transcriptional regulator [Methylobacterium sp. ID0610]|uniref:sugar-binding transcriptional regulator n=1 Tax=Methylobacterium carpenticola TaxID=3344827 RepID=UPI003694D1AF
MSGVEDDLKTRVAWLYYMEGLTQDQIAQVFGITRARVLRMLAAGREDGTVQIRIVAPIARCVELERAVRTRFGMHRVVVVPQPQDEAQIPRLIGTAVGHLLTDILQDGMTIGLGWGRTLSASLPVLSQMRLTQTTVVSMLGGLTHVSVSNPSEFAWRFADRLGGDCYMLAGPVFAPDHITRETLKNHSGIAEVFQRTQRLDLALLSVGELTPNSIFAQYGLLDRADLLSLERAGAIGDILCWFIDAEGRILDHSVNDRVLAVHPDQLQRAKQVILASGGWSKFAAVRAAIRIIKPSVLVTDERTAERLLDQDGG